ncbi:MAG: hypothetical protein K2O16_03190 [Lachnospiraceae bacterium]|nr:hypothetical protein [Lachnospiraceae bacterium]
MITDEQLKELEDISRDRILVVNRCEELGGFTSPKYLSELNRATKKSEEFHRKIQKPERIISETPYDYSQEKIYHQLSMKRLEKNGIHP